jgi:DNA-binding transcriptional MocR family regulator
MLKQILALFDTEVLNATTKVLYKLLEFAEFNTGKVYMTPERVDELLNICGISRASYHRAINELIKRGVISKNKGTYTIAENMFWKGDRKVRDDIINSRLMVSFSPVFSESEDNLTEEK